MKGGTLFIEQNSAPLFNKLYHSCRIWGPLVFVQFEGLSRIHAHFNCLWRTTPNPSAGWGSSVKVPCPLTAME